MSMSCTWPMIQPDRFQMITSSGKLGYHQILPEPYLDFHEEFVHSVMVNFVTLFLKLEQKTVFYPSKLWLFRARLRFQFFLPVAHLLSQVDHNDQIVRNIPKANHDQI